VTELHRAGLLDKVDGGFAPHNWEGRQYERVKVSGNGSRPLLRPLPKRPQSRAEQKQSRADAPRAAQVDLVEEALRADLREVLGAHVDLGRVTDWIGKGYDPGMIREVVRELRRRKPDIAALAYFDAALADRHARRATTPSERASIVIDWDGVISMFTRGGPWSKYAGPEPGMLGCRAPRDMLAKHGIDAATGQKVRKGELITSVSL